MIPKQKSFGDFIRERHGSNWVYAHRSTPALRAQYDKPDLPAVVITPKMQRKLAYDYAKEWGREHDPKFWHMLCALRGVAAASVFRSLPLELRNAVMTAIDDATTLDTRFKA